MQKVILVTGASRGIGAATAILAAAHGYAVCINYAASEEAAEAVAARIRRDGGNAITARGDVSNEAEVRALFRRVDSEWGGLDALVNNVGILQTQRRVEDLDAARLEKVLSVNVIGSFLCAREAVRRMSSNHGGRGGAIVNVSSIAARTGAPGEYVDYAASKAAIDALTVGLAKEVAGEGIRVNSVRPAFIYTDIHASGGEPGRVDRVTPSIPMRRGGQPEEVAKAVLWLLSDEASYVTGAVVDMAGGV